MEATMRLVRFTMLLPLVLLAGTPALLPTPGADPECTIWLGTDPEPPECVENPGGVTTIFWSVTYSTTPDYVYYRLTDPNADIVEEQYYSGDSGVDIVREWVVPEDSMDGAYWVGIEYWSEEVGLEGVAEVVFLVCSGTTPSDHGTWGNIKGLFR